VEDFADKTEAPTQRRRDEARRLGDVARSPELSAAVLCLGAVLLMQQFGPGVAKAFERLISDGLSAHAVTSPSKIGYIVGSAVAPVLVGILMIAAAVQLAQTGFVFRFRAHPIDPAKNFQRIFGGRGVAQLVINLIKLALVGVVTYFSARGRIGEIVSLQNRPFAEIATAAASLVFSVGLRVGVAMLVIGALDYGYQWLRHERELRMTRREVKEEQRQHEGAPETKRRRRQNVANLAAVRLERQIALADVIVTGCDVAVAVQFDANTMLAPRLVARGKGTTARTIRETGAQKSVAVIERDALASTLFRAVATNSDVPDRLFAPVAELIAYAYELKRRDV
jgi:flagellar biosynthetic protein FlhB